MTSQYLLGKELPVVRLGIEVRVMTTQFWVGEEFFPELARAAFPGENLRPEWPNTERVFRAEPETEILLENANHSVYPDREHGIILYPGGVYFLSVKEPVGQRIEKFHSELLTAKCLHFHFHTIEDGILWLAITASFPTRLPFGTELGRVEMESDDF